MRQWEIESAKPIGDFTMKYLVPPCGDLKATHERLLRDDPCWIKPRIRVHGQSDPAKEFWKRLKIESVRVQPD